MADKIGQFHQYGHCKFAESCDKTHTPVTCDSFPCLDSTCHKRHPRRCKFYDMYGQCRFAERCSFLHYNGCDQTANEEFQAIVQEVNKLRQEIETLREENERLRSEANARFKEHNDQNENNRRLLEMIKDIKEEVDVDRVIRGHNDIMVEDDYRTAQASGVREDGHGMGRRKGDKTGGKNMRKVKSTAPERSLLAHGTTATNQGSGRG
jgi:hypothetical protein